MIPKHKRENMQSLLMYIPYKGEYIKMAQSVLSIHIWILEQIAQLTRPKWPIESKKEHANMMPLHHT